MKKVIVVLVAILAVASVSMAKVVPAKTAVMSAPVTTSAAANTGFVGVSLNFSPGNVPSAPSARFGFGSWSLDLGGTITSAGGASTIWLFGRGDISISQITDSLRTYFAPQLSLCSAGGATTIELDMMLGGEYMFAPHLSVFADLNALSVISAGGATTWSLATNSGQIYTGARLYF